MVSLLTLICSGLAIAICAIANSSQHGLTPLPAKRWNSGHPLSRHLLPYTAA